MTAESSLVMDGPIKPAQRRALFAAATGRGLDIDDIRAMTPTGSISAMSRLEAAALLDRMNAGSEFDERRRPRPRGPRRPKGVLAMVTTGQRAKVEALRIDLAWSTDGLAAFLADRHYAHGGPMARDGKLAMLTTNDASEVIELLKAVVKKQSAARSRSARADSGPRSPVATGANAAPNEGRLEDHSSGPRVAFEGP